MLDESRSDAKVATVSGLGFVRTSARATRVAGARPKPVLPDLRRSTRRAAYRVDRRPAPVATSIARRAAADGHVSRSGHSAPTARRGLWGITPDTLRELLDERVPSALGSYKPETAVRRNLSTCRAGQSQTIETGDIEVTGRDDDGSVIATYKSAKGVDAEDASGTWPSHNAETVRHGAALEALFRAGDFPFPKSLYAVEDCSALLRRGQAERRGHRLLRRLRNDRARGDAAEQAGRRTTPVASSSRTTRSRPTSRRRSARRAFALATPSGSAGGSASTSPSRASRPRSPARPRTASRSRATTSSPTNSRWPTASRRTSSSSRSPTKRRCAWRATASSPRSRRCSGCAPARAAAASTTSRPAGTSPTRTACSPTSTTREDFLKAVAANDAVAIAYIVTDEDRLFESVAQELPDHVEPVRLYEAYLRNFEIESGRGSL